MPLWNKDMHHSNKDTLLSRLIKPFHQDINISTVKMDAQRRL
jgi:hypothetical protein